MFSLERNGVQVIRVTDVNHELVSGAKVEIPGSNYVFYTNILGECYISSTILRQYHSIRIHSISYKSLNINTKEVSSKIILEFR